MAMQTQTCCCCFSQRTGCYLIGAFNVVIGGWLFLQGVHTGVVAGSIKNRAVFELFFSLVYLVTSMCLLRGAKLQKGNLLSVWVVVSIMRLLGESIYVGFVEIAQYPPAKEWTSVKYPDYVYGSEYDRRLEQYRKDVAVQDAEKATYAVQQVIAMETILAHSLIMVLSAYFILSVHMYRRRLRTEKEASRPAKAEQPTHLEPQSV